MLRIQMKGTQKSKIDIIAKNVEFYKKIDFMINDQVRKIIVINQNIKETLDENGFVIIGAIDFLLRFIK